MKKILNILFLLANLGIILYFWLQGSSQILFTDNWQLALGRLAGLILAFAVLVQFTLMSRAWWLEKVFGLDKLSRFHHIIGKYLLVPLILHPLLLTLAYAKLNETGYLSQYIGFLQYEDIPKTVIAFWLLVFVVIYSVIMVWEKWKFEKWYYAHLAVYLAIVLGFSHQLDLGGSLNASSTAKYYWMALYTFTAVNLLVFRFGLPVWNFFQHRFQIKTIVKETHDTVSVYITGKAMDKFHFQAGQFLIVRFLDKDRWMQAHPFSLSQGYNGKELRLSIKSSGDFTSHISSLKPQTSVFIEGPYGTFTAQKAKSDKILLIAGGIGVTPIRGILETLGKQGKKAILLYANKTEKDIALRNEIETIGATYNFPINHILSNQPESPSLPVSQSPLISFHHGIITPDLLKQLVPDIATHEVFLCGPPPMMEALTKSLVSLGVSKKKIYSEKFYL